MATVIAEPSVKSDEQVRNWTQAKELRAKGTPWRLVSAQTGIPVRTIRDRADRERWDKTIDDVRTVIGAAMASYSNPSNKLAHNSMTLRALMVEDSLAAMQRIVLRPKPQTNEEEAKRIAMTRELTAQADTLCGWSEQDRVAGAICVGEVEDLIEQKGIAPHLGDKPGEKVIDLPPSSVVDGLPSS